MSDPLRELVVRGWVGIIDENDPVQVGKAFFETFPETIPPTGLTNEEILKAGTEIIEMRHELLDFMRE